MICDVVISRKNNKYIARVKDYPEIVVEEISRDSALTQVRSKLIDYLTNKVELVQIEVPIPTRTGNPWLDKFGWFKNDPTFEDLQSEISAYRKEIDREMRNFDE